MVTYRTPFFYAPHSHFGPIGDLDGDGRAEVVIRSPLGLGIIGLQDAVFRCPTLHAYGSHLGVWVLERNGRAAAIQNFTGTSVKREFLIQKGLYVQGVQYE